jgi:hypothetical protein
MGVLYTYLERGELRQSLVVAGSASVQLASNTSTLSFQSSHASLRLILDPLYFLQASNNSKMTLQLGRVVIG